MKIYSKSKEDYHPSRPGDGGLDLKSKPNEWMLKARAKEWLWLTPGVVEKIPTGLYWEPESDDVVGLIKERSSLAQKGFQILGGVIDASYRGEIILVCTVVGEPLLIETGERIAQLVTVKIERPDTFEHRLLDDSEMGETERGTGGFGSTNEEEGWEQLTLDLDAGEETTC